MSKRHIHFTGQNSIAEQELQEEVSKVLQDKAEGIDTPCTSCLYFHPMITRFIELQEKPNEVVLQTADGDLKVFGDKGELLIRGEMILVVGSKEGVNKVAVQKALLMDDSDYLLAERLCGIGETYELYREAVMTRTDFRDLVGVAIKKRIDHLTGDGILTLFESILKGK